jgi:proline dehydrogenase
MLRSLFLYLSERKTPKQFLTSTRFGRRLASRFIAGEHLDDAIRAVRQLNAAGLDVTLDCLGESVQESAAAEEACATYLGILQRIAQENLRSHISIKLTQLGVDLDHSLAQHLLGLIVEKAVQLKAFVRIDMESSAHVDATLRIFRQADAPREALGIVIQSYLYRSEQDLADLLKFGARIRLVKGAYKEPPEVAFPDKARVNEQYMKLTKRLLSSGIYHAIATHDINLLEATKSFVRSEKIGPDQFEFQMLYGIRRGLQRQLVKEGYRVRVYVPYGTQWYPYFMRRLAERPANLLFLMRNLFRE